jgi:uncharacterized cupredoxin-like copper-binding protein
MKSLLIASFALVIASATSGVLAHAPGDNGERPPMSPEQTAWGIGADEAAVDREVVIRMDDKMRFYPDHLEVAEGETLRLVIHNDGQLLHELVLGTRDELEEHAEMMEQFPNMEHDAPYMAHVDPGQTQNIVWTFNRAGRFEFVCLLPGHFQAGMKGGVQVVSAHESHH